VYASVAARLLANAEALNMVESVGNVARHRRVPIIVPREEGYSLIYAPSVSGECLANAYQRHIVELAGIEKLPVCESCKKGFFIKHGVLEAIRDVAQDWEKPLVEKKIKNPEEVEKLILENCIVEDICGFLLPEEIPAKRTSKFKVSFMVPTFDAVEQLALESQFHVRYAPDPELHRIYYVEIGSVLYALQMSLEVDEIGRPTMLAKEQVLEKGDRLKRIEVAVKAMASMLENRIFGARLSRINPISEVRSILVAVSTPLPFTVTPPHGREYMKTTAARADAFKKLINGEEIKLFAYDNEKAAEGIAGIQKCDTISSLFSEVLSYIKEKT